MYFHILSLVVLQEVPDELADMAERYQEFRDRNGYDNGGERRGRGGGGKIVMFPSGFPSLMPDLLNALTRSRSLSC